MSNQLIVDVGTPNKVLIEVNTPKKLKVEMIETTANFNFIQGNQIVRDYREVSNE